ncbi:putative membrane protein [Paraburkholderia fungorum]|jgi:hypothetical protein|uniref:Membrane protein n=1 Tax=Paraburkholderia fungorum TaxID=134537 RepID=A0AAW3UZ17_9BURK|nr:hypothetical protein [Paraburkholderia fungorum]AJZ61016.1 putative membrane protein [Paraburkholderia fungorum]MBB4514898.1 hypothetical protein [Paraburkholderia fungorum]MBB5544635.1 hypothetical protein [Paraburkholderia fungorum]MBB6202842.1 hypothetical protein [Paraburkholderia fungorum]MDE1004330.1 hypothetical protein [Paraburkholderia fungorum]
MHKIFTYLESDENYARVLKWSTVVICATAIYMLGVFAIGF